MIRTRRKRGYQRFLKFHLSVQMSIQWSRCHLRNLLCTWTTYELGMPRISINCSGHWVGLIWKGLNQLLIQIKSFYNIARALVLSKSHWAIMNKIFMYARPCSIKWRVQFHFSCKIVVEFSVSSFCLSFDNVKIILNNPNPTSSLWVLPGKDVYFNVSILTLFVSIFMEYLYFVCLRFHYNLA